MRFNKMFAAVAAVFAIGAAQADVLAIDDFDTPFSVAVDTEGANGFGVTAASSVGAGNLATSRVLFSEMVTAGGNFGGSSSLSIGPSPNNIAEALNALNGSGVVTNNVVTWTLDSAAVSAALAGQSAVSLFFDVLFSDNGQPSSSTRIDFTLDGVTFTTIYLGATSTATTYDFALDSTQIAALATGSTLAMAISGAPGYDLTVDRIGLIVPEPTSLALAGLALVGAGVAASRRRKA